MTTVTAEVAYRGPEACKLAGVTYRQLDWWARSYLVVPSIAEAHGSGTQRRYSAVDIVCLRLVCAISAAAGGSGPVNTTRTRRALDVVRAELPNGEGVLVLSESDVRLLTDPLDVSALLYATEPLLLVPLAPLVDGLFDPAP